MNNKILTCVCFLLIHIFSYSQNVTLSGFIYDSQSHERLINAMVYEANSRVVGISNEQGYYSIPFHKGLKEIKISLVGYTPDTFRLNLTKDTVLNFFLKENAVLGQVTVTGQSSRLSYNGSKVQVAQLSKLPAMGGEADVMKTLQFLPGVQSTSEGQAGFSIKGGDDYQNLVLLDGVPVYNSNHLFGFFSIFNEKAIQDITLYKGDFPAKYGGRLSSVVDIQTKEGNAKKFTGSVSVGLLAASADVEGPLINDKTTFFLSGRQSYLGFIADPIIKYFSGYEAANYGFGDINAKITHRFDQKNKLIFSFYRSYDFGQTSSKDAAFYFNQHESVNWGNSLSSLTWNRVINSKLFLNTLAHYSRYNYSSSNSYGQTDNNYYTSTQSDYQSTIHDIGINTNLTWFRSSAVTLKTGLGYTFQKFLPGVESYYSTNINSSGDPYQLTDTVGNLSNQSHEIDFYTDNDFQLRDNLMLHAGFRYVLYKNSRFYSHIEPRLNLEYSLGRAKFGLSYTLAHQYNHLLTTSEINQATDLWVPSTKDVKPERAIQYSFSVEYPLNNEFTVSAEAYCKVFHDLLAYKDGASYLTSTSWEEMVTKGRGNARGISFTLEKRMGHTTGWIAYTLSKAERRFDEINNGEPFPFSYAHRHDFKVVLLHQFSPRFDASCAWFYHWGNYVSYGTVMDEGEYIYLKRNGYELPAFHRLDLSLNYHIKKRKLEHVISLSVYNAYNRKNIYNIEFYNNYFFPSSNSYKEPIYFIKEKSLFPIIPSVTYRINFN